MNSDTLNLLKKRVTTIQSFTKTPILRDPDSELLGNLK